MKKILITGGNGLVGKYLNRKITEKNYQVFSFGKEKLDITDREICFKIFNEIKPEIIVHLAALTDVDYCEKNPEKAYFINSYGTENISIMAEEYNSFLIYLSTDFIFDGEKKTPYTEEDIPNPVNIYGKSKLKGEEFVKKNCRKYLIIRTSRIFGKDGKNFGSKLPFLMKEKKEIFLTTDIINSPTYASDLTDCIKKLIEKQIYGIINVCNKGWCSWFDFGTKMKEFLKSEAKIKEIKFDEFSKIFDIPAKRPVFSPLSLNLLESMGIKMRPWEESIKSFIEEIFQKENP